MNIQLGRAISAGILACGTPLTAAVAPLVEGRSWSVPLVDGKTLDLVWIPPGTFTMGSPATEPGRKADEDPQTHVTLTKGFWLGKTFVTVGQWKKVMNVGLRGQLAKQVNDDTLYSINGKNQTLRDLMKWSRDVDPSTYLGNEGDELPMYFVSWNDAMEFSKKLNDRERASGRLPEGYEYNLPTEAQWEYACRAGTTGATFAGPNSAAVLDKIAWYDQNSAAGYIGRSLGPTRSGPREVAQKQPNPWGLYDMYGNIWQWCRDWYGPYPGGAVTDPTGPDNGAARVNRGGSFGSGINSERSACRAANPQPEASAYRGFRIALCRLR
jgi:sulfatase modifying factor 1